MNKRINDIILLILLGTILLSAPLFWLSRQGDWNAQSELEGRYLTGFPRLEFQKFKLATK